MRDTKLSKAQIAMIPVLDELGNSGQVYSFLFGSQFRSFKHLVAKGLAFGGPGEKIGLTNAGKAVLAQTNTERSQK